MYVCITFNIIIPKLTNSRQPLKTSIFYININKHFLSISDLCKHIKKEIKFIKFFISITASDLLYSKTANLI